MCPTKSASFGQRPKLMEASHTGNVDAGEEASFQALRDPFSTNYSKCLRQASSAGASDGGSWAEAAGASSLVFSEIFFIFMFSLPTSP